MEYTVGNPQFDEHTEELYNEGKKFMRVAK